MSKAIVHESFGTVINQPASVDWMLNMTEQDWGYLSRVYVADDEEFINEFAHKWCFVLAEGLLLALQPYAEVKICVLYEYGVELHFFNAVQINEKTFWIDAYGVYRCLEPILSRYHVDTESMSIRDIHLSDYYSLDPGADKLLLEDCLYRVKLQFSTLASYYHYRLNATTHLLNDFHHCLGKELCDQM